MQKDLLSHSLKVDKNSIFFFYLSAKGLWILLFAYLEIVHAFLSSQGFLKFWGSRQTLS